MINMIELERAFNAMRPVVLGWIGQWASYTPTPTGFSSVPGASVYRYTVIGKTCIVNIHQGTDGTSNANTFTVPLPITAASNGSTWQGVCGYAVNNGTALTGAARWYIAAGGTAVQFYSNMAAGTWTASGGKRARAVVTYEIA